ncbi:MAG: hypothetical protein ABFS14_00805 [Gemmatimonadota bacterium]
MQSRQADETWRILYERQLPRVRQWACREYLDGLELLRLPADRVPSLSYLNDRIEPLTGWKTVRTAVRYTDAVPWYGHFARREFLVTDYMRDMQELDFTPEPDMFHDIFGHLPFFMNPAYAQLQELFAPAFLCADRRERENIKRLAWFSTEFGVKNESGRRTAFGAGLISGADELLSMVEGRTRVCPFRVESVLRYDKAVWSHNRVLFEFPSLEALKRELTQYLDTIGSLRTG